LNLGHLLLLELHRRPGLFLYSDGLKFTCVKITGTFRISFVNVINLGRARRAGSVRKWASLAFESWSDSVSASEVFTLWVY
jgi:hypothetical protein